MAGSRASRGKLHTLLYITFLHTDGGYVRLDAANPTIWLLI